MNPLIGNTIVAFILDHLNQKLTLKFLSDHFQYSEKTIQRYFKHRYDKSVPQFIREQRLFLSYKLLITTPYPVKAIAAMVGYGSVYAFGNVFKKHFNISPEAFRKSYYDAWN